jgi:uncharacterized protein (PEP-CTERM system associated)
MSPMTPRHETNRPDTGWNTKRTLRFASIFALSLSVLLPHRVRADTPNAAAASTMGSDSDSGMAPPAVPAPTDAVLPRIGADPGVADEDDHMLNAFNGGSRVSGAQAMQPGWHFTPQIAISEEYTTNAGALTGTGLNGGGSDFVTLIQPSIAIDDVSQRLTLHVDYRPTEEIFANNSGFTQFEESADGSVLFAAVPDWLYLDARGSIGQQSVFGGLGPNTTITLSPNNRETIGTAGITPYVAHDFGGTGTLQAGYGFMYTAIDAPGNLNNEIASPYPFLLPSQYGSSWLETNRAFASFTTGPDFGRLRDKIGVDANIYDGSGALRDAHRILVTDDVSYAVNRFVSVLGQIGYEDMNYPRVGYSYNGLIGAGGVTLTPNQYSSLTAEYRYVDGFGAPYVQASYQLTPRLRIFGGYSEGISTFDQDAQNSLLYGGTDVTGARASTLLAAPILDNTNSFGANQALSHERRLSATAVWFGDRDVITAGVQHERDTEVGNPFALYGPAFAHVTGTGTGDFTTKGWVGSASWRHDFTETISGYIYGQYGNSTTALLAQELGDSVSVDVELRKSFAWGLSAYVRYGGTYFVSGNSGPYGSDSNFTIGAIKRF